MDAPTRPVTQKDLAKALGLSQPTISMALKGDHRIPAATQQQVAVAAAAMGYKPSSAGSALAFHRHNRTERPRMTSIGWLNFWPSRKEYDAFREFSEYFAGASEAAEKLGYHLDEFRTEGRMKASRLYSILEARGIRGLLLPPHRAVPALRDFDWSPFSIVKFGRSRNHPNCHMASSDQLYNAILAYNTVKLRGYRRIGFISENLENWFFDAGYLKAQQNEAPHERLPILYIDQNRLADMKPVLTQWIKEHRPDALITCLHSIPPLLKACGLSIPGDIAFATTSILDGGADTGIDQNPRQIGRVAMLSLISLLHDNQTGIPESPQEILVKGKWVDGWTLPDRAVPV